MPIIHGPVWKQSYKEDSISVFSFLFMAPELVTHKFMDTI